MILRIASDRDDYDPKLGIKWCLANRIDPHTTGDTYINTTDETITYFKILEQGDLANADLSHLLIKCVTPLLTVPPRPIVEGFRP
jgi:hypothetical protein